MASRTNKPAESAETKKVETRDAVIAQPADPQVPVTVEDKDGIERIIQPARSGWVPRGLDPDPKDVARAKEREKKEKELAKERQVPLSERDEKAAKEAADAKDDA